ncbi:MAG: efflux RND transporter permease subunit [Pseudomonadota bacterium]
MMDFCFKYRRIILSMYLLLALAGIVEAFNMPVQLLPTADQTEIEIEASWQQNSPQDVERQMAVQLENALSTLPALKKMESRVTTGSVSTTLLFEDSADPLASLVATGARLNQIKSWPTDATEAEIVQDGISESATVATLLLYAKKGRRVNFSQKDEAARNIVVPALLSLPGVSRVDDTFSARDKVLWIQFDPFAMSQVGITVADLQQAVAGLRDKSGGVIDLGRNRVALRFKNQPLKRNLSQTVIAWREERPIYLGDVADIVDDYAPAQNITYKSGSEAYYLRLLRGRGVNSFEVLQEIKLRVQELNAGELAPLGLELGLSFDSTNNIERAINSVLYNMLLGITLVYLVLFYFLRRHSSALVVIATVPASIFLTLFLLSLTGTSLNVISLAGLALSVGLIIDAAVVVLEAIESESTGSVLLTAAINRAVRKVAKALFASTLTTLLIFIPIAGFDGDVGNLLADLALTMVLAMTVSFVVAMLILPLLIKVFRGQTAGSRASDYWQSLARTVTSASDTKAKRIVLLLLLVAAPLAMIPAMLPERELLPNAGDVYMRASINLPVGKNTRTLRGEVADVLNARLAPYLEADSPIPIRSYNLVVSSDFAFIVAYPELPEQLDELITAFEEQIFTDLVEVSAFVAQEPMIFFRSTGSKEIELNIHGTDLSGMQRIAVAIRDAVIRRDIAKGIRIIPPAVDDAPLLVVSPASVAEKDFGFSKETLGDVVTAYSGGLYAGEFIDGLNTYDMYLRGPTWENHEEFAQLQVLAPSGESINLGTLTDFAEQKGPSTILRLDGQSTVRLQITPPPDRALGSVVQELRALVAQDFSDRLAESQMHVSFRGSADEFEQAMYRMGIVVLLALLGLTIALTLTFNSLRCALDILLTLPIALFGGACAVWLMNLFSTVALDILTIIGFVIAAGLVLNNAILIVAERRDAVASGLGAAEALHNAVAARSRPIYISALTSILGMMPLMLSPGVGAEMYRGMAAVLVGAMVFSLAGSVFIVAALTDRSPNTDAGAAI